MSGKKVPSKKQQKFMNSEYKRLIDQRDAIKNIQETPVESVPLS